MKKNELRAFCYAGFYSFFLCTSIIIASSYILCNTFIINVQNIVSIILAIPLFTIYIQRFLLVFNPKFQKVDKRPSFHTQKPSPYMQNLSSHTQKFSCFIATKLNQFFDFAQKHSTKAFCHYGLLCLLYGCPIFLRFGHRFGLLMLTGIHQGGYLEVKL